MLDSETAMFSGATFGPFEMDTGERELRRHGIRLRLPDQSFEILRMLTERPGEVITREEIRERLWPNGTVVEFEHSMNSAVKRLRDVLGDSAATPRFIETLPRRGYVFVFPVQRAGSDPSDVRYRLLEEAGRGAMGVVYRAEDLRLGRVVALKFLPEELAGHPPALEQLRLEARTTAALNHPNICTLHGIEEHEGRPCIVMEYLEGRPLSRVIGAGPLPLGQAIDFTVQACNALEAAHARGIIHRDLKPANLFVTGSGQVKLMDFGIAVLAGETGAAQAGTPSYMSPEQVRGEALDSRSDIFSLGMVLLEVITGRRVLGRSEAEQSMANVPQEPRKLIVRCLEEDPANRFQTAAELKAALQTLKQPIEPERGGIRNRWRWTAAAIVVAVISALAMAWKFAAVSREEPIRSIAVLPLVNLSGDAGQEYFADGMTDVLTSDLAELGGLRVTSRTSAMTFKGSRKPVRAIADALKVDAVVEGSVSRAGTRVRIVAQLIHASSDTHLWSKTYESDFEDVLRLQAKVAEAIANAVKLAVTPGGKARLAAKPSVKPEAYEAYLKGMYNINKFTPEGFQQGMAYLQQAVDRDPSDPFAYAGLALGYSIMGHDRFPDAFVRAKAAAIRSLELGGPLAEAYAALGMEELYSDWDLVSGERDLRRALDINPNFAEARRHYSWYLHLIGRYAEGLAEMKRAEELEPLAPLFPADFAWQLLNVGRLDEAMAEGRKSLELNPQFAQALAVMGWIAAEKQMYPEALAAHQKAALADGAWKWPLGRTSALAGNKDQARLVARDMRKNAGPMDEWGLAVIYAALGEKDEAFRWLEAAYRSRFSWMPYNRDFIRPDFFASLREDPRFDDIMRRVLVRSGGVLPRLPH